MDQAKLISLYLSQTDHYHSDSASDMIKIADMHPGHAANAARVMLFSATQWALDAGMSPVKDVSLWMVRQPLWRALVARATS